jgi:TPR repeat protein
LFTKGLVEYNKGDFLSAVQWFRKAAEQGHAGSQYWLGYCYENGKGVGKNSNAAVLWYRNAAEQGNTNARYKLTKYDDVSRREREKEAQTIAEQQQQQTLAEMFTKGIVCYENKDYPTAVGWFRKAAQQGYVQAQNWLGYCYYNGHGVTKDYNVAVGWFRKSAQQGYAEAQFCLGLCYAQGDGVKQNERRAGEWFTKAAQQGLAEAQYMLGLYFECGTGVEKDIEEAKKWYQKAADQGNEDAKKALSKIGKGFFGRLFG